MKMNYTVTTTYHEPQSPEEALELYYRRKRALRTLVALAREKLVRANSSSSIIQPNLDSESFSPVLEPAISADTD